MAQLWIDPFSGLAGETWLGLWQALGVPPALFLSALKQWPFPGFQLKHAQFLWDGLSCEGLWLERMATEEKELAYSEAQALLERFASDRARSLLHRMAQSQSCIQRIPLGEISSLRGGRPSELLLLSLACLGFKELGEPEIWMGPVGINPTGSLDSAMALELLRGFELAPGPGASTHLMGAALASEFTTHHQEPGRFIPERILHVAGSPTNPDVPCVGRALWGQVPQGHRQLWQVEVNLDEATPEQIAWAQTRLSEDGALDVWICHGLFRKGRPGWVLSALIPRSLAETILRRLASELPTLSARAWPIQRIEADRRYLQSAVEGIPVEVKEGIWPEGVNRSSDFEDSSRASRILDLPLREVQNRALLNLDE